MTRHLPLLPVLLLLGCSSGSVSVSAVTDPTLPGVRLTVQSEGKNTFSMHGASCTAEAEASCQLAVPASMLQPGWNTLTLETDRRTDDPVEVVVHVGEELFPRDCTVTAQHVSPDPTELTYDVLCRFPTGFSGELAGRPLVDGRGTVAATGCVGPVEELTVDLDRPLLRGAIPLVVVNEAGGRMPRSLPVAVPAPVVQLALGGWAPAWYEAEMPLELRAEEGATVLVNGEPVSLRRGRATVQVPVSEGHNAVRVEARMPGRAPTVHQLDVQGLYPQTPLLIDQRFDGPVHTTDRTLRLSGSTLPQAKLYLNSRPLDHRGGFFSVDVPLEEGKNEVSLLAVVDRDGRREPRPLTRVDVLVHRYAQLPPRPGQAAPGKSKEARVTIGEVGADPWAHLDQPVRFTMTVDEVVQNPSMKGECIARIAGRACTDRVGGDVLIGWGISRGWACVGDEQPVAVEVAACDAREGDDALVHGVVRGALGGRVQGVTVDRPRIEGSSFEILPTREALPRERWPDVLPARLGGGR